MSGRLSFLPSSQCAGLVQKNVAPFILPDKLKSPLIGFLESASGVGVNGEASSSRGVFHSNLGTVPFLSCLKLSAKAYAYQTRNLNCYNIIIGLKAL